MAQVIYTPRNYIQIYDQLEQYMVGSGVGLTNFNVGSRIRALLEAFALVSGQSHYQFYQGLIAAIPVALYDGLGFTRLGGIKASGNIKIGLNAAPIVNTTVPSGITINISGNEYVTTTSGLILAGQNESGIVNLQAAQAGAINNLAIGDLDIKEGRGFFSGSPGFDYAYNTAAISGGTDQESDEDRRTRFIAYINGLTKTTVSGIQAGLLALSTVRSVYVRELFPAPGWNTVYVDDGSGSIPPALLVQVNKVIYGDPNDIINFPAYKAAGIRINVLAPTLRHFVLTINFKIDQNTHSTPAEILLEAETAISNYVDSLRLGQDVIMTQITRYAEEAHADIIDVAITAMTVDGNPVPIANFTIAPDEISKVDSFNSTYDLILRS